MKNQAKASMKPATASSSSANNLKIQQALRLPLGGAARSACLFLQYFIRNGALIDMLARQAEDLQGLEKQHRDAQAYAGLKQVEGNVD
jgi:hypothetical protein